MAITRLPTRAECWTRVSLPSWLRDMHMWSAAFLSFCLYWPLPWSKLDLHYTDPNTNSNPNSNTDPNTDPNFGPNFGPTSSTDRNALFPVNVVVVVIVVVVVVVVVVVIVIVIVIKLFARYNSWNSFCVCRPFNNWLFCGVVASASEKKTKVEEPFLSFA
jgi:hypothetical protein